jgi:hypothetical protein
MTPRWHRPDWETFARSVGFSYSASNDMMPSIWDEICVIEGSFSKRSVRAAAFLQKGMRQKAVVRAAVRSLDLRIVPAGLVSAIAGAFGAQDVVVGDQAFDKAVVVKAKEPERAKAILLRSDWLRGELTARASAGHDFTIDEAAVIVETQDESIANVRTEMEWAAGVAAELERAAAAWSYRSA